MSRVMSDFRPVRTDLSFGCLVFATICLQKFALPSGEFIGVPVIALWGILLWLMSRGVAVIDPFRAALFAIILFGIVLSMLIERQMPRGPNPLILMLIMYAALMFRVDVDHSMMLRCLNQ